MCIGARGRGRLLESTVMAEFRRSWWSRIAAFLAIALHVSLPLLAQAAQTGAGGVFPLCGRDRGTYSLERASDQDPGRGGGATHREHCGVCAFNGAGFAVPPCARGAELPAAARSSDMPRAAALPPALTATHPPAHPRAPPLPS